jgi:hypothetical protein
MFTVSLLTCGLSLAFAEIDKENMCRYFDESISAFEVVASCDPLARRMQGDWK